jgi:hypothetical protein
MGMNGIHVIDADGHIRERDEDLRPHLPEPYRSRDRQFYPTDNWDRSFGGKIGRMVFDLKSRLADMDLEQIDLAVLYPTNGLSIGSVREPDFAAALCTAYNTWLAALCAQSPRRLRGVALVPINNVPAAVKEVERAAGLGLIGVMLAAHGHGKNLGEPEFHPLYAACERLNMPVGVHAAQQGSEGLNRFTSFIGVHAVSHPFEQMICATGMILGGIPELFPRLRITYLEAGCGWVPYWMWRLDEEYEKRSSEAPLLKAKPSEYMRSGRIFYSCDPDEELIDDVMNRMGEDVIIYASDYPHWDALFPDSVKVLMANSSLSDKRKKKIFDDNPRRFYPALA